MPREMNEIAFAPVLGVVAKSSQMRHRKEIRAAESLMP